MIFLFGFFSRLSEEYEKIAEKALTSPANTEHLMELKVSFKWKGTLRKIIN